MCIIKCEANLNNINNYKATQISQNPFCSYMHSNRTSHATGTYLKRQLLKFPLVNTKQINLENVTSNEGTSTTNQKQWYSVILICTSKRKNYCFFTMAHSSKFCINANASQKAKKILFFFSFALDVAQIAYVWGRCVDQRILPLQRF